MIDKPEKVLSYVIIWFGIIKWGKYLKKIMSIFSKYPLRNWSKSMVCSVDQKKIKNQKIYGTDYAYIGLNFAPKL